MNDVGTEQQARINSYALDTTCAHLLTCAVAPTSGHSLLQDFHCRFRPLSERAMSQPSNPAQPGPPGGVERRVFSRRRLRGTGIFVPDDKPLATPTRITLVDISQSGIGFMTSKELLAGQLIRIELDTSSVPGRPKKGMVAEVRWSAPAPTPGQYRVGCAWTSRLSYADLLRFS